jgi:hypothetical protein
MKGASYAVIGLIAFVGIIGVMAYSVYQMSYGGYSLTQVEKSSREDIARARLEFTKNMLTQNLKYSGHAAMLVVAAQGGTIYPVTYWWCNSKPQPPSPKEFSSALSNFSILYFNAYINISKENENIKQMNVKIEEYKCAVPDDPGAEKCIGKDSSKCEAFDIGTIGGGRIEVHSPGYKSYFGNIETTVEPNRGYWLYWNLYNAANKNLLMRLVNQELRERCTGPESTSEKIKASLDDICKGFEALFDGYVNCSYEVLCLEEGTTCLNTPCEREPIENICSEESSLKGLTKNKRLEGIILQGQVASARINFIFTDYKYSIPTERGMEPLRFIISTVFEAGRQECRPIDER